MTANPTPSPTDPATVNPTLAPVDPATVNPTLAPVDPATLAPTEPAQPVPPNPGFPACNVCGENGRVTIPDGLVIVPGQEPITCETFELAGDFGFIDPQFCPIVVPFTSNCGCQLTAPPPISNAPTPSTMQPSAPSTQLPSQSPVTTGTPTAGATTQSPVSQPVPPSPGFPLCNVCGANDSRITLPDTVLTIPGQDPVSCSTLQQAGDLGFIDEASCPVVVAFASPCGCTIQTPTSAPILGAPRAPVMQPIPPSPGFPSCNVCGADGARIAIPTAVVTLPEQGPVSCGDLQRAGDLGFIQADACVLLPPFAAPCGCSVDTPTSSPILGSPPVPPSPGFPSCNVCGAEGSEITEPDAIVDIPDQDPITCSEFQRAGNLGFIDRQICSLLSPFASSCGCTVVPTAAPNPAVAPVPPSPNFPACNVCGPRNLRITVPDAGVALPGQEPVSCADFQLAGDLGFIDSGICPFLPPFAFQCGCSPPATESPSIAPIAATAPRPSSPAPSNGPTTPVPTPNPTMSPTATLETALPSTQPTTDPTTSLKTLNPTSSQSPTMTPSANVPKTLGPSLSPTAPPQTTGPSSGFTSNAKTLQPTTRPSGTQPQDVESVIRSVAIQGGAEFSDPNSYQSRALEWMQQNAHIDQFSTAQIVQRYALASIFFSTNSRSNAQTGGVVSPWFISTGWVTDDEECVWYGISCNPYDGSVRSIDLVRTFLPAVAPSNLHFCSPYPCNTPCCP